MSKVLLLTGILFLAKFSLAQKDSLKINYEMKTLYAKGNRYIIGSESYKPGELEALLNMSPEGMIVYRQGLKNYQTGKIISWISALSVPAIAFMKNDKGRLAFLFGGAVINLTSLRLIVNGKDRIQKAIWIRNRDVLF